MAEKLVSGPIERVHIQSTEPGIVLGGGGGTNTLPEGSTDGDGHLQADIVTLPLPTGAATSANQDTIIVALNLVNVAHAGLTALNGAIAGTEVQADIVAALPAGENVIGLVGAPDTVITVTPTLDTSAYAAGDLLFDSTEIASAVRANGSTAILQSVTVIDKADQKVAFTLIFANAATDFGTLNSAPDPDDTEAATVIGWVPVTASDYVDLGGASVACLRNLGLTLKAGGATTSLYIAGVNGSGTPTYAASDLVFQLGFLRS